MDRGPRSSGARLAISDPELEARNHEMGLGIPLSNSRSQLAISYQVFEAHKRAMDLGIQTFDLSLDVFGLVSRDHNREIELGKLAASGLAILAYSSEMDPTDQSAVFGLVFLVTVRELGWDRGCNLGQVFF